METLNEFYLILAVDKPENAAAYRELAKRYKNSTIYIITLSNPEVLPMEPQVLPDIKPKPIPRPNENDPFNVPAPLINPTPKGFSFFS